MKTKIVYVVVCGDNNTYIEQAAVSACSVRRYNPDVEILLLVDKCTNELINNGRNLIKDFISEIIEVPVPSEYDNKMRSRYIKTTVRDNVKGDYLFIDTDTVITGDLSEIDNCEYELAAVCDLHTSLDKTPNLLMVDYQAKKMGWQLNQLDYKYFNSGVMYVKDTLLAHEFYKKWNKYWLIKANQGLYTDQPALAYANSQCGYVIGELHGKWNCQLFVNGLPFLSSALIIHYFSSGINKRTMISPYYFSDQKLLNYIYENQKLPFDFFEYVDSPKEHAFPKDKTLILCGEDSDVFKTDVVKFIYGQYYYHPSGFYLIKKIVDLYYWFKKHL